MSNLIIYMNRVIFYYWWILFYMKLQHKITNGNHFTGAIIARVETHLVRPMNENCMVERFVLHNINKVHDQACTCSIIVLVK